MNRSLIVTALALTLAVGCNNAAEEQNKATAAQLEAEPLAKAFVAPVHEFEGTKLLYDKAIQLLGETGTVELVGLLGYYSLVSMTLNTFDVGIPDGETCDLVP